MRARPIPIIPPAARGNGRRGVGVGSQAGSARKWESRPSAGLWAGAGFADDQCRWLRFHPGAIRSLSGCGSGAGLGPKRRPHNGRLYFVYLSEEPQESSDTDVQMRYSDDNGMTWSNALRVNDDTDTNSQFNPRIAFDGRSAQVAVAWYDARNDKGDNGRGDTNGVSNDDIMIYSAVSKDGGNTFTRNRRLSLASSNDNKAKSGVDYGDYAGFAFFNGTMIFSAADNSNSTGNNPDGALSHFDLVVAPVAVR